MGLSAWLELKASTFKIGYGQVLITHASCLALCPSRAHIIHALIINLKPRAQLNLDIKYQRIASFLRLEAEPRFTDT